MGDNIRHGIQNDFGSENSVKHGVQKKSESEFNRRPWGEQDKSAPMKFDKQTGPGPSGHAQTQSKGLGKHSSIGGSSAFVPKGKVSSFGGATGKFGTMKTGLSGQKKGVGA